MATICSSDLVKLKAGTYAELLTYAQYSDLIEMAETQLIADTGINWVSLYSSLSATYKPIVESAVAALAAVDVINYNPLTLGSLNTATTAINVNLNTYDRAVAKLKESNIYGPFGASKLST